MIKLTKQELTDITNKACDLLYNHRNDEKVVLRFEESNGTLIPSILPKDDPNYSHAPDSLFLSNDGENPSLKIYMHLATQYGMDDAFS